MYGIAIIAFIYS